jgi:hypothetical protein
MIASAYYQAATSNADMYEVVEALEDIRAKELKNNVFALLDSLDRYIGRWYGNNSLQPIFVELRNQFQKSIYYRIF